jgi:cysteine synthase A
MTRRLHREYGLLVGTSSGANVVAALRFAQQFRPAGAVVTVLCDRVERYFSTLLFDSVPSESTGCATLPVQLAGIESRRT